ncbi:probable DEAD-box ATP-dependent RNA helicase 48 [Tanacetum coccineum]|uniref:ATP-dependent RNA helicase n=1 Tax=Tanacetum coccineum TaxID=301880 RepID=A0ABQ5GZ28_9ASTR
MITVSVLVVDMSSYQARDRRPRYPLCLFLWKKADQPSDPYLTPHSCGETCGKVLDKDLSANASYDDDEGDHCSHRCVVQCHPGPCPPYKAFAPPKMCPCGKKKITIRCSDQSQKSLLTCRQRCGKLLSLSTRELASQIAAEANVLLKYHEGIGAQTLVGGTPFKVDQQRLETSMSGTFLQIVYLHTHFRMQIIIATPGRLLDHIENKSGFSTRLMKLKMLIRLGVLKGHGENCRLFTSSKAIFTPYFKTSKGAGLGPKTHDKVNQALLIVPHEQHFQIVNRLLKDHIAQVPDYKVILFCTTAMMTSLMYSLLCEMRMNVREIHSRKPPLYRTRVSEEFKEAKKLILVTSDVLARGMNYPDLGVPTDRERYINRLGRTGREGKSGEGTLLVAPREEYFLQEIKDLPIHKSPSPHLDPDMKVKVEKSMVKIDLRVKEAAYHAWLG